MSFQILPMTAEDLPTFTRIHHSAFSTGLGSILTTAPPGVLSPTARSASLARQTKSFNDPHNRFFKAIDPATGEIVAFAKWHVYLSERSEAEVEEACAVPPMPKDATVEAWEEVFGWLRKAKREWMGGRPSYCLGNLITDPRHQGRGAGRQLIQWGMDEADKAGLIMYLESSPPGKKLYERCGFETVAEHVFDLGKYGGEGLERYSIMVRQPKPWRE
ncbi:acyl-CoA N-acyltransferase [Aulographum hederae CBS 113979]|uniref:Acyl-CoA N-acyltransferase n=1 Tax=Aulographum hederae CBS 113979 TaxID=1176131 RepID=A0A6G1H4A8_9PEZI|nr:acyl-CoA N-acyltransferase [Aulographum hederae CBS 113979]